MRRRNISLLVSKRLNLPHSTCDKIVKEMLKVLTENLLKGEGFVFQNFCSMYPYKRKQRLVRLMESQEKKIIPAQTSLRLKISRNFRRALNKAQQP